jgi:hypothetical protein
VATQGGRPWYFSLSFCYHRDGKTETVWYGNVRGDLKIQRNAYVLHLST